MDKETLSNYGWIVICVMVLAVMLAFASPFGNFVADAIKSTTQGLFDVNQGALDSANIHIMQQEFENMLSDKDPTLNPTGATITNNTYSHGDYIYSKQIISGNELGVQTLEEGKQLIKEWYTKELGVTWEEILQAYGITEEEFWIEFGMVEETFEPSVFGNTWNVSLNMNVTDKNQTHYGPILESINGETVASMDYLFQDCKSLIEAPVIPNGIKTMSYAFSGCSSLTTAPIIPNNVSDVTYAFAYCKNMKTYAGSTTQDGDFSQYKIPSNITSIAGLFNGCKKMTIVPTIPNKVTDMESTFQGCDLIVAPPVIPESVINLSKTFSGCKSLTVTPIIPEGAKDVSGILWDCTSITVAPRIPNGVTEMHSAFNGCTSLRTYVGAPAGTVDGDFSKFVIPSGVKSLYALFEDCILLTAAPVISSNVNNLAYTFFGCTSLTGTIEINTNNLYREYSYVSGTTYGTSSDDDGVYAACFHGVNTKNIIFTGSATSETLDMICKTGNGWTPIQ